MANLNVETALARNNAELVKDLGKSLSIESPLPLPRFTGRSLQSRSKRSSVNTIANDDEEYNKTVSEEAPSTGGRNRIRMAAKESILACAKSLVSYNKETPPSTIKRSAHHSSTIFKFKRKKDFSSEQVFNEIVSKDRASVISVSKSSADPSSSFVKLSFMPAGSAIVAGPFLPCNSKLTSDSSLIDEREECCGCTMAIRHSIRCIQFQSLPAE